LGLVELGPAVFRRSATPTSPRAATGAARRGKDLP